MKTIEELGISPTPWSVVYDPDNGVPYRIECTRPKGLSNRVLDDCDGILDPDANLIAAAPKMYEELWKVCFGDGDTINCRKCTGAKLGNCKSCSLYGARSALAEASGESV